MNNFFKCAIAAFIFLSLFCHKCYSIDDREKLGSQPPMASQPQQMQNPQPSRPMPLLAAPSLPPVFSPAPPHVTAPPVSPFTIAAPPPNVNYQPAATQANFGNTLAQTMLPGTNVQGELPQIPVIGNSLGKVMSKGVEKDGLPWVEIKDEFFNETLKIKINPKSTPIIKKATVMNYNDIKIGDTVSVIFNQQDENITANFVSILTEEDLKAMEESLKAEASVKTENETKDNEPPENLKKISE